MRLKEFHSEKELEALVKELGFLPFFRNEIVGFSVEDCCPPELWFSHDREGPWEWKGPVIRGTGCAYGKFYAGKACFIDTRFFGDFLNYRRDGYDYDARRDDGLTRTRDHRIMEILSSRDSLISKELKFLACPGEDSKKTFESSLTFLQMQTYILTSDFQYMTDKNGKRYGWGVARYATPEAFFGADFVADAYRREPNESRERLLTALRSLLPDVPENLLLRFLG